MTSVIIACRTIKDELDLVISETKCGFPVLWMDGALHSDPDLLKKKLQEELDHIGNIEQAILGYGYCGNALIGIKANSFRIIFPRVDDCISLVLGSCDKRKEISKEMGTYFFTKGWLSSDKNMWTEYLATVERYGKERTDKIMAVLYKHYKRIGVIDTGAYDINEIRELTEKIAKELKLQHQILPGTIEYIKKMITGPWDNDFIIVNPGEAVTMDQLYGETPGTINVQ